MFWVYLVIAVALVAVNVVASILAVCSKGNTRAQKNLQLLLTWLIPVVGGIVVTYFHWEELRPSQPMESSAWNDSSDVTTLAEGVSDF